jgi:hypothetical protein
MNACNRAVSGKQITFPAESLAGSFIGTKA